MPEPVRLVGVGAGGHAKVAVEIARAVGGFELVGLLDPRVELHGSDVLGVPVLGDDALLSSLYDDGVTHAFIGLGSAHDMRPRARLHARVRAAGFEVATLVHPAAVVSPSAALGAGATVCAAAVVQAGARLGEDALVNTGAIVEHDCVLGDHVHVASGARLASGVRVGDLVHVGLGACVNQNLSIGTGSTVGAGAVVVDDVPDGVVVVGVPARILREAP